MGIFGWFDGGTGFEDLLLMQQRQRNQATVDATLDMHRHNQMREVSNATSERKKRIYKEIEMRKVQEQLIAEVQAYRNIAINLAARCAGYKEILNVLDAQGKLPFPRKSVDPMVDNETQKIERSDRIQAMANYVDQCNKDGFKPSSPYPAK